MILFCAEEDSARQILLFGSYDDTRKVFLIGLVGDVILVIDHRVLKYARSALLGNRDKRVCGIVMEIDSGSSDDRIELSVYLERVLNTAAAGVPHNVGIGIDIARA